MNNRMWVAREALLHALDALLAQRAAVIVVGAQALYLRTGDADLAVAPFTNDADLVLDPDLLLDIPAIERAMLDGGLARAGPDKLGVWVAAVSATGLAPERVPIDLMVPAAVAPGVGRRDADLPRHGPRVARKVTGLEGALVDRDWMEISSVDPAPPREVHAQVAGPAALLVAKAHKISDRGRSARAVDKDALDVLRLLRAVPSIELARRLRSLAIDPRSQASSARGLHLVRDQFLRGGLGLEMIARAVTDLMDPDEARRSCELLTEELLDEVARSA